MVRKKILVCSQLMPEFDRESGSRRIYDLIEFLRGAGWDVTFLAQYAPNGDRYARLLRQRGVAVYTGFNTETDQMIAESCFDVALIAFWHIAEQHLPVIRRISPKTRIIVDSIDLHFVRSARGIFKLGSASGARLLDSSFAAEMIREVNTYAAADGVLTVSQKEADLVNDLVGDPMLAFAVPDCEEMAASEVPFDERNGILFLGNFRHVPNVGAAEFLCRQIAPRLDAELVKKHPLYIVGNDMDDKIRAFGNGLPNVHMVGWVPSVSPYLERARVTVIPLLYGAGTKRKLIQALMVGTPTVSTTIGVEGLNLSDETNVMIADEPAHFAECVNRLLRDQKLWERVATTGRQHICASHGREGTKTRLLETLTAVLAKIPKSKELASPTLDLHHSRIKDHYCQLIPRIRKVVENTLPMSARVLVVSRGDEELMKLEGRQGWHFPQNENGVYAGHHPANSDTAIAHLEALRRKGAEYLLLPHTAFWWFDHYSLFHAHLQEHYDVVADYDEACRVYDLRGKPSPKTNGKVTVHQANEQAAPWPKPSIKEFHPPQRVRTPIDEFRKPKSNGLVIGKSSRKKILVLGIYLANKPNLVHEIVPILAESQRFNVTQRWIALGGSAPNAEVASVTVRTVTEKTPKYKLLNELLQQEDLSEYEFVLSADDDVTLPSQFIDGYFTLQTDLDFMIAQPARTSNSFTDHPIVEQQQGVVARQTLFVEIGPVVSFHRSIYPLVFPFDLTSSMGWGYENVWSYMLAKRNLKMGIIDALPVEHSMRKPVAHYNWDDADQGRAAYLAKHPHFPVEDCFRVLDVINQEEAAL